MGDSQDYSFHPAIVLHPTSAQFHNFLFHRQNPIIPRQVYFSILCVLCSFLFLFLLFLVNRGTQFGFFRYSVYFLSISFHWHVNLGSNRFVIDRLRYLFQIVGGLMNFPMVMRRKESAFRRKKQIVSAHGFFLIGTTC